MSRVERRARARVRRRDAAGVDNAVHLRVVCHRHPSQRMAWWYVGTGHDNFGEVSGYDKKGRAHAATEEGTWLRWREDPDLPKDQRIVWKETLHCPEPSCRNAVQALGTKREALMKALVRPGRSETWTVGSDLLLELLKSPEFAVRLLDQQTPDELALGMVCHRAPQH